MLVLQYGSLDSCLNLYLTDFMLSLVLIDAIPGCTMTFGSTPFYRVFLVISPAQGRGQIDICFNEDEERR